MFKVNQINEYTPIGNSLTEINENFSILDTRTCLFEQQRPVFAELFTSIQSLSSRLDSFTTTTSSLSSELKGMSDLVYNMKDYWLNPITLVYPKSFSVVANYQEIQKWLDDNFSDLAPNQLVKVQFLIKSFDDQLLAGTQLEKIDIQTLNALSATYGIPTKDIQRYIVLDNHIKAMISIISNILNRLFIKLKVEKYSDLDVLIASCAIHRHILTSSLLSDISYTNLLIIWSYLQQYSMIKDEYLALKTLGMDSIPSNVTSKFNTKNVIETFFGTFCFLFNDSGWDYIPDCSRNICIVDSCSDCYDVIDVNNLYSGQQCKLGSKYVLLECDNIVKDNTKHVFRKSSVFKIPTGAKKMMVKSWGTHGGGDHSPEASGNPTIKGGGGGFSYGEFDVVENTAYYVAVNEFAGTGIPNIVSDAGGLCGVFENSDNLTQYSYNRALIVAGGGGGAVADEDGLPSGMFLPGLPGNSGATNSGGNPTMKGTNGSGVPNANNELGSGGGGFRGGTHRKGGTGYISPVATNTMYLPGVGTTTANTGDSDYSLLNSTLGGVVIEIEYDTNFILE